MENLKTFYHKCVRVWKTLKKPSKKEFEMTAKVSAIGIVILGIIGFVISIIMGFFQDTNKNFYKPSFLIIITTSNKFQGQLEQSKMIFIIKVQTNKEDSAVEMIAERAQKKNLNVYSVLRPHGLRGYIILETEDRDSAEEAVYNLPYIKGIVGRTISYDEIKNMLESNAATVSIEDGDIVEIIGSTLKGEKAKVLRIDKQKEEVVVSLLGAVVPLPVTIKMDNVKVIRRESEGGEE